MNFTKKNKQEKSVEIAEKFKSADSIFFTSYQGLKFQEIYTLREKLVSAKCSFNIVRNTILKYAVKGAGIESTYETSTFKGPTALAIQKEGDIVVASKILAAFGKDCPSLKVKACYSSGRWYNVEECKQLSKLGTYSEVMSQFAGNLYGCVSQIASVMQAPIRDLAFVLKAVEDKKNKGATAA